MLRKRMILLLITTLVLLTGWGFLEYLVDSQINNVYREISNYPVILYSYDINVLHNIQQKLNSKQYIKDSQLQVSDSIAVDLIRKYNLGEAMDVIESNTLPNVLLVYLQGNRFSGLDRSLLKQQIDPYKDSLMVDYQDNIWSETLTRSQSLRQIHLLGSILFGLLMFLVFLLQRLHYEKDMSNYWKIYARAGGDTRYQQTHFWQNTALICIVPTLVNAIVYYVISTGQLIGSVIPAKFFLVQLIIIGCSSVFAKLMTPKS
ncbi:MAG TPA: hypothetical protein PLE74_09460 [Candidatus Cloacimonadota bacterium]|nr:hypothetical protein [Candidatus Cloacimonadota bacterium]